MTPSLSVLELLRASLLTSGNQQFGFSAWPLDPRNDRSGGPRLPALPSCFLGSKASEFELSLMNSIPGSPSFWQPTVIPLSLQHPRSQLPNKPSPALSINNYLSCGLCSSRELEHKIKGSKSQALLQYKESLVHCWFHSY